MGWVILIMFELLNDNRIFVQNVREMGFFDFLGGIVIIKFEKFREFVIEGCFLFGIGRDRYGGRD